MFLDNKIKKSLYKENNFNYFIKTGFSFFTLKLSRLPKTGCRQNGFMNHAVFIAAT